MRATSFLLAAIVIGGAAVARADDAWVGAPVLDAGAIDVALVHEVQPARYVTFPDQLAEPWADGIDVAVAVAPRWTLGLSHSARAQGTVDHGGGWCHDVRFRTCPGRYAGALLDARWRVRDDGRVRLTALGRLGAVGFGPVRPVVRLGGSARVARGAGWLVVEPEVQISLGHRELGNRDVLVAPLWLGVGRSRVAGWLQTGVRGQLVGLGDKWELPLMVGGAARLGPVRAGVELGWPKLIGPVNIGNEWHAALWIAARLR